MKTYLLLILWAAVLCGCSKLARTEDPATAAEIPVCFQIECPQMDEPAKALTDVQEKTVKDLNLYLYCKNATGKDEHIYSAGSANITRKLTVGDYDLFVIANAGGDLGNMTRAQVEQSARTVGGEAVLETGSALPLSAKTSFSVKAATTVPVVLRRIVACIELNLSVAPQLRERIALRSVQILSAPLLAGLLRRQRALGRRRGDGLRPPEHHGPLLQRNVLRAGESARHRGRHYGPYAKGSRQNSGTSDLHTHRGREPDRAQARLLHLSRRKRYGQFRHSAQPPLHRPCDRHGREYHRHAGIHDGRRTGQRQAVVPSRRAPVDRTAPAYRQQPRTVVQLLVPHLRRRGLGAARSRDGPSRRTRRCR